MLILDIDRLRAINETEGFDAGDALIVAVGRLLQTPHLPEGAVAARAALAMSSQLPCRRCLPKQPPRWPERCLKPQRSSRAGRSGAMSRSR